MTLSAVGAGKYLDEIPLSSTIGEAEKLGFNRDQIIQLIGNERTVCGLAQLLRISSLALAERFVSRPKWADRILYRYRNANGIEDLRDCRKRVDELFHPLSGMPKDIVEFIGSKGIMRPNPLGLLSRDELEDNLQETRDFDLRLATVEEIHNHDDEDLVRLALAYGDLSILPTYPKNSFWDLQRKEAHLRLAIEVEDFTTLAQLLEPDALLDYEECDNITPNPAWKAWDMCEGERNWGIPHGKGYPLWDRERLNSAGRALIYAAHAGKSEVVSWLFREYGDRIDSPTLRKIQLAAKDDASVHLAIAEFALSRQPKEHAILQESLFCLAVENRWEDVLRIVDQVQPARSRYHAGEEASIYYPFRLDCRNIVAAALAKGRMDVIGAMIQNLNILMFINSDGGMNSEIASCFAGHEPFYMGWINQRIDQENIWKFDRPSEEKLRTQDSWGSAFLDGPNFDPTPAFVAMMKEGNWDGILAMLNYFQSRPLARVSKPVVEALFNGAEAENREDVLKCLDGLFPNNP